MTYSMCLLHLYVFFEFVNAQATLYFYSLYLFVSDRNISIKIPGAPERYKTAKNTDLYLDWSLQPNVGKLSQYCTLPMLLFDHPMLP